MEDRIVNQEGRNLVYIERNSGDIYVVNSYVEEPSEAFQKGSQDLFGYTPTIKPAIHRGEVDMILNWIEDDTNNITDDKSPRVALLYGVAGIGKSVVMRDILAKLKSRVDYSVLGIKSDQTEFVDSDDLSRKLHLAKPIENAIRELAMTKKRVVLLIDQIDALSLSLSSNRTPLRSLLNVVKQIKDIPHVRVVISCRPYDLEYDPLLSALRVQNKWELKELSKEQVLKTLKENNRSEHLDSNLLKFLGNPLNLYLFLKVNSSERPTDPLSTDLLYNQLWNKYVNDDSERKVDKEKLLKLLDALVEKMYKRQELSVHISEFSTKFTNELSYLLSNGLIITNNDRLQFFHQTLFSYIYARRFMENGRDLLAVLEKQHQGLFSRAAVKDILTFQRKQDPKVYIHILDQLLYAEKNGKEIYRYHLKALALSNMAYFEDPIPGEIHFISKKVFPDNIYMNVLFESVHTISWYNAIWSIIDKKGGWKNLSDEYKEKTYMMCISTLASDAGTVLDKLDSEIDYNDETDLKYMSNLLSFNINCESGKLITLYNKLVRNREPLEFPHVLERIVQGDPTFVCKILEDNVCQQLKNNNKSIHRVTVDHEVNNLYEKLLEIHHEDAIQLLIDNLTAIFEATKFKHKSSEIYSSLESYDFVRTSDPDLVTNFINGAINIVIDDILKSINEERSKRCLKQFSVSEYGGFVYIALYVYTSFPDIYKDDFYKIIITRQVLSNAPVWVEYQAVEALKKTFILMDDLQKKSIISRILTIIDDNEQIRFFKESIEVRLQYGHPILDIGLRKGRALEVIPLEELRRLSWSAYQERQFLDRKFNHYFLANNIPHKIKTHFGWTALSQKQGLKMSPETWYKSMLTYNENPVDWNTPSLTGQCDLFKEIVSKKPDEFIELIDKILVDERILIAYPLAGMQGLIKAGRYDDALHVFNGILNAIDDNVNSTNRGFSIMSLLFAIDDFVQQDHVPETIIGLLCNTLKNAKESTQEEDKEIIDLYTTGINQPRGCAGYNLVKCSHDERYKDVIFQTLENIAESSSVYTRAAILLNLALLNNLDKDRNVSLFKKLMYDFDPRLMAMPVHNLNPLVYFVNYAVGDLMDFFRHASSCPECYPEQIIILWLAWSHNGRDERIKIILDKMCSTSLDARIALINFFGTFDNKVNEDVLFSILNLMRSPQYDSQIMGETFDNLFYHLDNWPDDFQKKIAETYVNSPLCKYQFRGFIGFLAGYALKDPVQVMKWLEQVLKGASPDDFFIWNQIIEVIIQAYNGIRSFNDENYQGTLERAMDLIDNIMRNQNNKYLISNFINKLDHE